MDPAAGRAGLDEDDARSRAPRLPPGARPGTSRTTVRRAPVPLRSTRRPRRARCSSAPSRAVSAIAAAKPAGSSGGNSATPESTRKHLKPNTPASCSGCELVRGCPEPRRPRTRRRHAPGRTRSRCLTAQGVESRRRRDAVERHVDDRRHAAGRGGAGGGVEAFPLGASRLVDVHVRVDETGQQHLVVGQPDGLAGSDRLGPPTLEHGRDASVAHGDDARALGAVDDRARGDEGPVEHGLSHRATDPPGVRRSVAVVRRARRTPRSRCAQPRRAGCRRRRTRRPAAAARRAGSDLRRR